MALSSDVGYPLQLIVGLGNKGENYDKTRHNAGFWFLDSFAMVNGASFSHEAKFFGQLARIQLSGKPCYLLKPMTFMNRSGQAVSAVLNYYKISPKNMLVAHDELDFDAGIARLKRQGGHGGHNGLRDIIQSTGEKGFLRLRIGIGHPRNNGQNDVSNYVLASPSRGDRQQINEAIDLSIAAVPLIVEKGLDIATQQLHQ